MKRFFDRPATSTARLFQELADYHAMQDKWGATMGLWFDVAGTMARRDMDIPSAWQYRQGAGGPDVGECNEEVLRDMPARELARLGEFCHRLAGRLDRYGLSY